MVLALFTPGHYIDSICFWIKNQDMLFTGDTIFVGRTGRTISSRSSISDLYSSVYDILLKLPLKTIIYPGHHYGFSKSISIKENISISDFFQCKSLNEFKIVMDNYENNRKKWFLDEKSKYNSCFLDEKLIELGIVNGIRIINFYKEARKWQKKLQLQVFQKKVVTYII